MSPLPSGESSVEVVVTPDPEGLAEAAAERFSKAAEKALAGSGRFTVALAGGSTPKGLYALLASEPYRSRVPWPRARVFWGDERCVPPTHGDSNYRMAEETLLRRLPIPREQIYRIRGEDPDPDRAAAEYEQVLKTVFGLRPAALPRFDLILLGMGADGHTASLFPRSPALREVSRLAVAPYVEQVGGYRITLTLPVLNHAACVMFLVSGQEKAATLRSVLAPGAGHDRPPAGLVAPQGGVVVWLADRAAARLLQDPVRGKAQS